MGPTALNNLGQISDMELQIAGAPTAKTRKKSRGVQTIVLKPVKTDEEMKEREGTHWEEKEISRFIDQDADVYRLDAAGKKHLLARYRKGVFSKELTDLAWEAYHKAAAASRNRGAAAGPIDVNSEYWKKRKPVEIQKWAARYEQGGKVSKMRVNNNVLSSVLGYFESTPFMKLPCRLTSYTQTHFNNYKKGFPYIVAVDRMFKKLFPGPHAKQLAAAKKKPMFQIEDTAFSSLTINRNFRTAMHKDAGDYEQGFGNITVVERGKYHGGYTCFPQYGVGFNVRMGDFLGMDVHQWHTNTEMYETAEDKAANKKIPRVFKSSDAIVSGSKDLFTRISFVMYLREKLQQCDEKETRAYYAKIGFNPDASTKSAATKAATRKKRVK